MTAAVALLTVVALAPPLLATPAAAAPPKAAACPSAAPNAVAAAQAAAACRGRVEVAADRDERTLVFANANGTFTTQVAAVVQRVKTADGRWTKPDPALHRAANGRLIPAATALRTSFSGGGDAALVSLGRGSGELTLRWPGPLPVPAVRADSATYADVLPGVDLVLTAQVEGFSEVLVVKSAAAAADPALAAIRFPSSATGLRLRTDPGGALSAVDGHGTALFGSGTPAMWDSGGAANVSARASGRASAGPVGAGSGSAKKAMPLELAGDAIVVHPDLSLLRGSATRYPVYIDPAFGASSWTMINSRFTGQSYWSYDRQDCPTPYASIQCAKVGYTDEGQTMVYRSIFAFAAGGFVGRHVLDAKLSMDTVYSWTNTDYPTSVHVTGGINAGTTWSNNVGSWQAATASAVSHANDRVRRRTEWGVTAAARSAATGNWSQLVLGLRAPNESDHNQWKKFDAGTAVLTVTYNSYPNAPDQLSPDGSACATGAGRPYARTLTPQLRARVTDPDGAARLLSATFYWWPLAGGSRTEADKVAQGSIASGGQAVVTVPAGKLTDGVTYVMQAITSDGVDTGQYSPMCEFTVDVTAPSTPGTTSSSDYPADGQVHGGAGVAGSFLLRPPAATPADFSGYAYTLDPSIAPVAATQVAASATDHTAAITLTPPTDGQQTLRVWARDVAGNYSASPSTYAFVVRAGAGPDGLWSLDESAGTTAADSTGHGNPATVTGATWTPGRGSVGNALAFNSSPQYAQTAGPLATRSVIDGSATTVRTDTNLTVSAWVRLAATSTTAHWTAVSQDGARTSAYLLGYDGPDNRWWFAMAPTDVDNPTLTMVRSNSAPTVGAWTQLTATYDAASHLMRLYVNGVAQTATATLSGGFNAGGPFAIGRGRWTGANSDYFNGAVDDVRVYARVLSSTDAEFNAALRPQNPLLTFPAGATGVVGQPFSVTISAGGDPTVTSVKYSVGTETLASTAALPAPGGQVTVTVTRGAPGAGRIFAAAVSDAGRVSTTTVAIATFRMPPSISGQVTDVTTGEALSGVTVRLAPVGMTTTTDLNGAYAFSGMAAGSYTITAAVDSVCGLFGTTNVDIVEETILDLALSPMSDEFGYRCDTTGTEPFVAGSQVSTLTGDDEQARFGLPFPMHFYDKTFASAWVSTNGVLMFNDPADRQISFVPVTMPYRDFPNGVLAPFWDDLVVDAQASIRTGTLGTAPNRQFVIEWHNVTTYDSDGAKRFSFEVVLSENGDFSFRYADLDDDVERGSTASVGIESPSGAYGMEYSYQKPSLASGKVIGFQFPANPQPLPTYSLSGTITVNGGTGPIYVTLSSPNIRTVADANGHYSFSGLDFATYDVDVSDGCHAAWASLDLSVSSTFDAVLQRTTTDMGYFCYTATPAFVPADTTVVPLTGDDAETTVSLPFAFPLAGTKYTSMVAGTDGYLDFGTDGDDAEICGFCDDLVVDSNASIRTTAVGAYPNRQFVVEWRNVTFYDQPSDRFTVEVALNENGMITVTYRDLGDEREYGSEAEVGISSIADTNLTYDYCTPRLSNDRAVVLTPLIRRTL